MSRDRDLNHAPPRLSDLPEPERRRALVDRHEANRDRWRASHAAAGRGLFQRVREAFGG